MDEANPVPQMAEMQQQADAITGSALNWSVGPLLSAQAELLAGAETTMADWLHRRREAIVDTQQLVANMHSGNNPVEAIKAQQEWLSRSFQRFAADAEACHAMTQRLLDRAPAWFPTAGWPWASWASWAAKAAEATASQTAAATRAANRPLRMANQGD